jgi:hypothetical protein
MMDQIKRLIQANAKLSRTGTSFSSEYQAVAGWIEWEITAPRVAVCEVLVLKTKPWLYSEYQFT